MGKADSLERVASSDAQQWLNLCDSEYSPEYGHIRIESLTLVVVGKNNDHEDKYWHFVVRSLISRLEPPIDKFVAILDCYGKEQTYHVDRLEDCRAMLSPFQGNHTLDIPDLDQQSTTGKPWLDR